MMMRRGLFFFLSCSFAVNSHGGVSAFLAAPCAAKVPSAAATSLRRSSPFSRHAYSMGGDLSPCKRAPWRPLATSTTSEDGAAPEKEAEASAPTINERVLDTRALFRHSLSLVIQMSLLSLVLKSLDVSRVASVLPNIVSTPLAWVMFYMFGLKWSRRFTPLNSERPKMSIFKEMKFPSWRPPPFAFPIAWLFVNNPLRATSATIYWVATGRQFFQLPLLAYLFHLSVGDVWNTINNWEPRLGWSATVLLTGVIPTAALTAWLYAQTSRTAGILMSGTMVWLCLACALTIRTKQLNDPDDTYLYPSKPSKESPSPTVFDWEILRNVSFL